MRWPTDPNAPVEVIVRKSKPVPDRFEIWSTSIGLFSTMIDPDWIDLSKWPEDPAAPKRQLSYSEMYPNSWGAHLGLKII